MMNNSALKKKFTFDGYVFSLLKFNKWFAVYVASEGPKILFYEVFKIENNEPVINRYGRYKEYNRVIQEYDKWTKKQERKLLTNN
jgi:hypothetical protein